jgi:ubiquinone/menaquinone biosynthesis C-methylase UbiE
MENDFNIKEVASFWDKVGENYESKNARFKEVHLQRYIESIKHLDLKPGQKILNLWSRTGDAVEFLKKGEPRIEITSMEVSDSLIEIARKKFPQEKFLKTDLENLNFENDYFHHILSLETLEHAPKPKKLLGEFYRVLKPGGTLVLSLPPKTAKFAERISFFFFGNHGEGPHNFLPSKTVKKLLFETGFNLILHKATLLIPAGPQWLMKFGEKTIEKFQNTFIAELGIRQFYVCKKLDPEQSYAQVNNYSAGKEKIILTFDLEFWHNSGFLGKYIPENENFPKDYIVESTEPILDLLNKYNHKATFFVLGQVAEKYPELIKRISGMGHEISSHGYSHKSLFELNKNGLQKEIELTNNILGGITGMKPKGFRAPNFSSNKKPGQIEDVINNSFQYSSSIHPLSFFKKYNPLKEFPPSLGGFYFRLLPFRLYLLLIKTFSKSKIPVLYFHPYELFDFTPKINWGPWVKRKIKYWGTKNAWKKFQALQKKFNFISFKDYFDENPINNQEF